MNPKQDERISRNNNRGIDFSISLDYPPTMSLYAHTHVDDSIVL